MKLKSKKKVPVPTLTLAERGLLWHMLETRDSEGLFQQHDGVIAEIYATSRPTVHRIRTSLIDKGAVEVVVASRPDSHGYPTTPILRPLPPRSTTESTGEHGQVNRLTREPENARTLHASGHGQMIENADQSRVQKSEKPRPSGHPNNSTDSDMCNCLIRNKSSAEEQTSAVSNPVHLLTRSVDPFAGFPPARPGFHYEMVKGYATEVRDATV